MRNKSPVILLKFTIPEFKINRLQQLTKPYVFGVIAAGGGPSTYSSWLITFFLFSGKMRVAPCVRLGCFDTARDIDTVITVTDTAKCILYYLWNHRYNMLAL